MIASGLPDVTPGTEPKGHPRDPVIVVGAGPVGCTVALLLADRGVPVTLVERHAHPHPLPRAVHIDDEVARVLGRVGVVGAFLRGARPATGLRLLDAEHRVMAEFPRDPGSVKNGYPPAIMFDQPDLEQLLLDRLADHPLVTLQRGQGVLRIGDGTGGPLHVVRVHARGAEDGPLQTLTGRYVLGCDGANSTIREQLGIAMDDLKFTERWLVVDVRTGAALDSWGGVEQVCDPARAATFMRVVGDRYRWEFQLHDGEDEADLLRPEALGRLLAPWTGRTDLDGLEIVRSAVYTFRARLARRFRVGQAFLLGDAAHLTPPFIGQGLGAGLRDADNLAWKLGDVLTARAAPGLLDSYEAERRPHARAMIRKAVLVGWAMTGGQDRAAVARRLALAAVVKSPRVCARIAATETPRLKSGAMERPSTIQRIARLTPPLKVGGLVPNVEVRTADDTRVRLDDLLAGRAALLTSRRPEPQLEARCEQLGLLLVRIRPPRHTAVGLRGGPGYLDVVVVGCRPVAARPRRRQDGVLVRPDGVVAAVTPRALPQLPWEKGAASPLAAVRGGTP
jgi:3-(3-hydroxy-phenyl)propionate hydroxylase